PRLALAQASITGTVKDTSGAVLPGVTVQVSRPALIEKVRSATTDASRQYRTWGLRPGTYQAEATFPRLPPLPRGATAPAASIRLSVTIETQSGAVLERVTVSAASPVVDLQNTRRGTVIGADAISSLPATRAYGSLLNAMPGVTVDNNGLAATPTMTFFSAHGGRTNEGRMSINGMTVAAAFNGGGGSS